MKKYLPLIFIFALSGCASISFGPVTHPEQRIQLGGFSFLPPNGEDWEMSTDPIEGNMTWENWGRGTVKMKAFKKSIVGPNQKPDEAEILKASINKYEFAIMKFDHDDDLMELAKSSLKTMDKRGLKLLESSFSHEKIQGMNCVRRKGKTEGGRKSSNSEASAVINSFQGYLCVHPRQSNHLIELGAGQTVLKGQTPIDVQNEFDHFLNSLQVH